MQAWNLTQFGESELSRVYYIKVYISMMSSTGQAGWCVREGNGGSRGRAGFQAKGSRCRSLESRNNTKKYKAAGDSES